MAGLWLALALASQASATGEVADPIRVFYDGGDCDTTEIEIELWDRSESLWRPHPRHVRVRVPSCQIEDAGRLLNELRWRCAPASAEEVPQAWRNFEVFDSDAMTHCAVDQIAAGSRRTAITVTSPAEGAVVRAQEPFATLTGSVDVDGLDGSAYDVVLLIDRAVPEAALAAQIQAARTFASDLVPRLGAVRIALISYPNPSPGPDESAAARRDLAWSDDPVAIDRALARVPSRSVVSGATLPDALDAALELLESGRPAARRTVVIGVDGSRVDAATQPAADDPLLRAAARASERGATLHWVALGGLAPDDPVLIRRALANARGSFRRVPPHAYATHFLSGISLPVAEAVWIETGAPGEAETPASLDADGRFRARVPLETGANPLVIHARTSDGGVIERPFPLVFDDALVPEQERKRIRETQRKRLELRPEAETP